LDTSAYKLSRKEKIFETPLVTAARRKPESLQNYLRFAGLLSIHWDSHSLEALGTHRVQFHFYVFLPGVFYFLLVPLHRKTDPFDYEAIICA